MLLIAVFCGNCFDALFHWLTWTESFNTQNASVIPYTCLACRWGEKALLSDCQTSHCVCVVIPVMLIACVRSYRAGIVIIILRIPWYSEINCHLTGRGPLYVRLWDIRVDYYTYLKVCYSPQQPLTTESEGKQLLLGSRCACMLQRNILLCIKELLMKDWLMIVDLT